MGCSWVPSPALTTLPCTQLASRCGAPEAPCRTTIASLPIASRVSAVSFRLSPLETLLPLAEKLMTSADSRLAASSKEMRVRVESSKKRFTTVRPRSVGSFLTSRPASAASIWAAVSSTRVASARSRSAASSRCRFIGRHLRHEDLVDAVDLGQMDLHLLAARGRHVLADEVRPDGQLAVPAVDQDRQLHAARAAQVAQRVQCRADRAAGEQHVVHQDDEPAVDAAVGQHRGLQRPDAAQPQVVAVEGDVDGADVDRRRRRTPRCGRRAGGRAGRRASGCRRGRARRGHRPETRDRSRRPAR